ncbi:F-box protein At3g12350-like [Henckelia pumila]|uniref:F-box protein At3g12350-like n=1 Tax=Henckelia pumila TaxID=405737 RepID=UPI003C6E682D
MEAVPPSSFSDFPEDVQFCILSFLRPSELAAFAATSKRFVTLCRGDQRLWFSMCDRRWGSQTQIKKWGSGKISYKRLYRFLDEYENLIGFWRRCGDATTSSPPLVFFEWGPFYLTGSRIVPSKNQGYGVIKKPLLWMSVTSNGEPLSYLDFDGKFPLTQGDMVDSEELWFLENELIQVSVSFTDKCHLVVEENPMLWGFSSSENVKGEVCDNIFGSPPDRLVHEIYQYFANRTSPGGNGASRRQRRREKEKQGRMKKWEQEHFVKIVNFSPKPSQPLQGLWKGICEDSSLEFYLVTYDDMGGIACRKVGESSRRLTYHAPVFWTSSTTFIESPFSPEEDHIYNSRLHLCPVVEADQSYDPSRSSDDEAVSRMLYINSSYDLVIPDLAVNSINSQQVEGRIWQYENGTFGFGFLRDGFIIDLKHVAKNGRLLDTKDTSNC